MRLKIKWFLVLVLVLSAVFNCTNKKYSDIEREKIILGIIVGGGGSSCSATASFSSLASAGVSSKCSGCHGGASPKAGLDVSSYTSVSARVKSGNPDGSTFYTAIKSGSMSSYSDTTINNAVLCWIKAGAPQ